MSVLPGGDENGVPLCVSVGVTDLLQARQKGRHGEGAIEVEENDWGRRRS